MASNILIDRWRGPGTGFGVAVLPAVRHSVDGSLFKKPTKDGNGT